MVSFGSDVLSVWGAGGDGISSFLRILQLVMVTYVATRIVTPESPGAWVPCGSKVTDTFANLRSG